MDYRTLGLVLFQFRYLLYGMVSRLESRGIESPQDRNVLSLIKCLSLKYHVSEVSVDYMYQVYIYRVGEVIVSILRGIPCSSTRSSGTRSKMRPVEISLWGKERKDADSKETIL
jgi:hypothetical protein